MTGMNFVQVMHNGKLHAKFTWKEKMACGHNKEFKILVPYHAITGEKVPEKLMKMALDDGKERAKLVARDEGCDDCKVMLRKLRSN